MRSLTLGCGLALTAALCAPDFGTAQSESAASLKMPTAIPIFPLPDVALFPNSTRPFHIFEERYRAMVADALAGDSIIGMVLLQPGYEAQYEASLPVAWGSKTDIPTEYTLVLPRRFGGSALSGSAARSSPATMTSTWRTFAKWQRDTA